MFRKIILCILFIAFNIDCFAVSLDFGQPSTTGAKDPRDLVIYLKNDTNFCFTNVRLDGSVKFKSTEMKQCNKADINDESCYDSDHTLKPNEIRKIKLSDLASVDIESSKFWVTMVPYNSDLKRCENQGWYNGDTSFGSVGLKIFRSNKDPYGMESTKGVLGLYGDGWINHISNSYEGQITVIKCMQDCDFKDSAGKPIGYNDMVIDFVGYA